MEQIRKTVKAAIFDMDGTIIQSEHYWNKAIREILSSLYEGEVDEDRYNGLYCLHCGNAERHFLAIKKEFGLKESVEFMLSEVSKKTRSLWLNTKIKFIEGFPAFHASLIEHGIITGLATNCPKEMFEIISKKVLLENYFREHMYCASDVGIRKPDPTLFLHTAKKLNVLPTECVVFEDSISGFEAAKAAGMPCIAIKSAYNSTFLNHADDAIDNYNSAMTALQKLIKSRDKLQQHQ